ncbi:MAG: DUF1292 domain-containing protein [Clostridium sp.]|nr:DUF1292 domain-containing protein [Clostridium sp.]MBO6150661.1 DUF1292 domain-containing protein [Clostridium sp.]
MAKEKDMEMAVDMEEFDSEEMDTVTVSLDDGRELECVVLAIYEAGEGQYIALLPEEEVDEEESTVFLYRYYEDENGEPQLDNIADDEEYNAASVAFNQILNDAGYDDIVDEEEL